MTWECDACRRSIDDDEGYIYVDVHHAARAAAELEEWERFVRGKVMSGLDLLAGVPRRAPWRVFHETCDPRPDNMADYWIGVERARTAAQLLDWTLHLMEKTWFPGTNWGPFLRRHTAAVHA